MSVPGFSKETGIPSARIYKWKIEGSPKMEDAKKIQVWLNNGDNLEEIPRGKSNANETQMQHIAQDASLQAIKNLTETGKIHAENYKVMVSNEARLITLLETTVGSPKDNGLVSPAIMSGILVAMAKIGSGHKWHSEAEALRELGRLLSPQAVESNTKKSTQIPEDK